MVVMRGVVPCIVGIAPRAGPACWPLLRAPKEEPNKDSHSHVENAFAKCKRDVRCCDYARSDDAEENGSEYPSHCAHPCELRTHIPARECYCSRGSPGHTPSPFTSAGSADDRSYTMVGGQWKWEPGALSEQSEAPFDALEQAMLRGDGCHALAQGSAVGI